MSMTRTHTKTYTTPVFETVRADRIEAGDVVLVGRPGEADALQRVQQVNPRVSVVHVVGDKHAPNAAVWPAIHIMLATGIVRFPHEPITRLLTEGPT